jgi:uncharacterized protein (TIGR02391 family)
MSTVKRDELAFDAEELTHLCQELADTNSGLTGSEIAYILKQIGVEDIDPANTKWRRLFNALVENQNASKTGNIVMAFIAKALHPARYVGNAKLYEDKLESVNVVLAFQGLRFQNDGKFHIVQKASNLNDAVARASQMKDNLLKRNLHNELIRFCKAELIADNYFHAVLEACKSIAESIRKVTGLTSDGASLIDEALGGEEPIIKINKFKSETEKSEQKGFVNLAKGLFGTFRNPTAHAPKVEWQMSEDDALDLFTLASYVLRRIENRVE